MAVSGFRHLRGPSRCAAPRLSPCRQPRGTRAPRPARASSRQQSAPSSFVLREQPLSHREPIDVAPGDNAGGEGLRRWRSWRSCIPSRAHSQGGRRADAAGGLGNQGARGCKAATGGGAGRARVERAQRRARVDQAAGRLAPRPGAGRQRLRLPRPAGGPHRGQRQNRLGGPTLCEQRPLRVWRSSCSDG